jgi:predicted transposase YbfD/YdcC
MGCQKDITSLILKKKGDYILALKGNQKILHKAVKDWFEPTFRKSLNRIDGYKFKEFKAEVIAP